jgi:hypothetical protein
VASRDPGVLVLLVPLVLEAAIYLFVLNKLAQVVSRYLYREGRRTRSVLLTLMAGCLVWMLLPVNSFDCMDGHGVTRCSALRMYFGWMRTRSPGTSLCVDSRCGDFGW